MNKLLLEYLLKLFALLANIYPFLLYENVRDFIKTVFLKEFSQSVIDSNILVFENYYRKFQGIRNSMPDKKQMAALLFNDIDEIKKEISGKQKFIILLRLLLFEKFLLKYSQRSSSSVPFSEILAAVSEKFQIDPDDFNNSKYFISGTLYNITAKESLLIISGKKLIDIDLAFMQRDQLHGQLFFFYLKSIRMIIFYYDGADIIIYNDKTIYSNHIYELQRGCSITGQAFDSIYYNQVLRVLHSKDNVNILIEAKEIEYRFKRSNKGVHRLSISMKSGEMIGMLGRSGAGKSTLLNLLNGNLKPSHGSIFINSYELNTNKDKLVGLVGYVPQDDLLIEELTVFMNLYLNAQLCFSDLSEEELTKKVNDILVDLNLYNARNLKVGSPLNKYISGGQRKKLNIALELIREPWILYADEPTSGLSSSDSEEIMQSLSELAISGKIVFVNVHQPSSDIFKLFDKVLVMDNDGYPAYFGNPIESVSYFQTVNNTQLAITDKCNVCGNLNTESIFKALEEKQFNELGELSVERKTSPEQWHKLFIESMSESKENIPKQLPENRLVKPNAFRQFGIFFHRNLLSKISNPSYVALALSISPFLALILAFLCKSGVDPDTKTYAFGENENITAFLFMSVIVSLFVGLIISAEEIIRDRRILVRESFLKLNKFSYLYSKVLYLFALSAVQTLMFVLISNLILEMHGMAIRFFIILFSASCFANLMGLLISSIFDSVVVIYILVPLLIVPQILLSGVVVNFEKLNEKFSGGKYVPLVGDLMVSRWAYEALLVSQFRYNTYQSHFFEVEKDMSNIQFDYLFVIPALKDVLSLSQNSTAPKDQQNKLLYIKNGLHGLYENNPQLSLPDFSNDTLPNYSQIGKYLNNLNNILWKQNNSLAKIKDSLVHELLNSKGSSLNYNIYKNRYYNKNLSEFLLKRQSLQTYTNTSDEIIRKLEPVYQNTTSHFGRAQFLAADKRIGSYMITTPIFNIINIWIMSICLLIALLYHSKR